MDRTCPVIHVVTICLIAILAAPAAGAQKAPRARSRSPHGAMERACTDCHTTASWKQVSFEHDSTGYALENRHGELTCVSCHRLDRFAAAEPGCLSCHQDRHQGALGADCTWCHDTAGWTPATFSHEQSAFPLWGAHGALDCVQCHADEETYQFLAPPQDCYDCHAADLAATRVSVHLTAGPDCETCHTLDSWEGGHDPAWMETRYGRHAVSCGRCHKRGEDYQSHTCVDCHDFPLDVQEHTGLDPADARCQECHRNGFDEGD
jgi:hypothetical protein